VTIPRPRERKAINHDPDFKRLRREVSDFLLNSRRQHLPTVSKKMVLPDIEPEDLSVIRSLGGRRTPIRRHEIKRETVEVE
jgi:nitrate/nitrite transport system ATP-binding protein